MIEFPVTIPVSEIEGGSRLFLDYVSGEETPIRKILGGFGDSDDRWRGAVPADGHVKTPEALLERLLEYNSDIGAGDDVLARLRGALDGDVRIVVTGQQPGALGGPLLALYKLSTAIALAGHLERTRGTPHLALYWVGSDDVDFREIRDLFLVDCDLTPLSTSIDAAAHDAASPVGAVSTGAVRHLWDAIDPIVGRCPHGKFAGELVRASLDGASDHGAVTARLLSALAGGAAAFVDGREPAVRRQARDLYLQYFDREDEVRESLEAAGRSLEAAGYHAQLWPGPDSGVFMVEDGRRKKITAGGRSGARVAMEADVTRFSPGVALRNLVQDQVFRPVAVVLGPAEIAYRAQLDGVYRMMGVAPPVAFPRMQATCLTAAVAGMARGKHAPPIVRLINSPDDCVKELYAAARPAGLQEAIEKFKRTFESGTEDFLSAAGPVLETRTADKARKRLSEVGRRLGQALEVGGVAGREAAKRSWPFLGGLGEFMRRKDKPQDRYLSVLTPYLFAGDGARASISQAADAFVEGALDGRTTHVVYSVAE